MVRKQKPKAKYSAPCFLVKQGRSQFIVSRLTVGIIAQIAYAAVRRQTDEEGAVQRIFDSRRISSLKKFALEGGHYPACIILNWTSEDYPLTIKNGMLEFTPAPLLAQMVDGQHRVEGLKIAVKEKPSLKSLEIPVAIYQGLTTQTCADIFLSINKEQKPVHKTLVLDLYGVASEWIVDKVANRARDLAEMINTEEDSPYAGMIRFPNDPRGSGIALSTVVSSIKPLVEDKGIFEQVGLNELNMQKTCIVNFFHVLRDWYGSGWRDKSNVFMTAAGFVGAMDFLRLQMIPHCNLRKKYKIADMAAAMNLDKDELIGKGEIEGRQGRAMWNQIHDLLKDRFKHSTDPSEIDF